MPLGVKVGLGSRPRRLYVRCGPRYPRKKGTPAALNFWPMTCGQTAGWIKMPLGTQVNVGPGDVVLDGVAAPLKAAQPPVLVHVVHVYCGQTAGWMKTRRK